MNVYDLAHQLAVEMKKTSEYAEYDQAKKIAMENETQKALIDEYKKIQFQLQVAMAGGGAPDPGELERMQKIAAVLQMSPDASRYIMAEFAYQRMLADIYKILGEAAGIDMDMLAGGD